MGTDKALLPVGSETALQRVVRLLSTMVHPIVVVAGIDQQLPRLPANVEIVRDTQPFAGPLFALAFGLDRLRDRCEIFCLTAVDQIGLVPSVFSFLAAHLGDSPGVVVTRDGYRQPFGGLYRTEVALRACREASAQGMRSLRDWLDVLNVRELRADDGDVPEDYRLSFQTMNSPKEYQALLTLIQEAESGG